MSEKPLSKSPDRKITSQEEGEIYLFPATTQHDAIAVRATSMEDAEKQAAAIRSKLSTSKK